MFDERTNYTLHVGEHLLSGDPAVAAEDAFMYHDKMMFTTYDRDNDFSPDNCAQTQGGGFWYNDCAWCGVNTKRGSTDDFRWWYWAHDPDSSLPLQLSRMWLQCK